MALQQAIWDWVQKLPDWQSDLFRRLCEKADLDDGEINEVCQNLLLECDPSHVSTAPSPVRCRLEDIPSDAAPSGSPRVLGLRHIKCVAAIEPGQELSFARDGLTIIYGDNGSGKSSYARMLKQACRAVDTSTRILPNVYTQPTQAGEYTIEYEDSGQKKSLKRKANTAPEPALTSISIVDAASALRYVANENEIAYIPSGLSLFEQLAKAQNALRQSLDEEITKLTSEAPSFKETEFSNDTTVSTILKGLSSQTPEDRIRSLAVFGEPEEARLAELVSTLAQIEATDPKKLAQDARRRAADIRVLKDQIAQMVKLLGSSAMHQLEELDSRTEAAIQAAAIASAGAFEGEPVKGVGSDAWRILWESARKFSVEHAYPNQPFPVTEPGSHCVLCHQPLLQDAMARMQRFEEFVRNDAAKTARLAVDERDRLCRQALNAPLETVKESPTNGLLQDYYPDVAASVSRFLSAMLSRLELLRVALQTHRWPTFEDLPESPEAKLEELASACDREAEMFEQMEASESREATEKEVLELRARKQLKARLDDVLSHIKRLKRIDMLRRAHRLLATNAITAKMNELTAQIVTESLRQRLQTELEALKCGHISVRLDTRGVKGTTNASLKLQGTRQEAPVRDVLSEGEQKAIALAFFLAEVGVAPHDGTIILDDPVSSLDHLRRAHIADRLAAECECRQVIVFTHDLVFLHELVRRVPNATVVAVRRAAGKIGLVASELPWRAMTLKARIGKLKDGLPALRKLEADGEEQYSDHAKLWIENLREAWEQLVEERLFNQVVQRFDPAVQTKRLDRVKDNFTAEIAEEIMAGMTETSNWVHDQSRAINCSPPTTTELKALLDKLEDVAKRLPV